MGDGSERASFHARPQPPRPPFATVAGGLKVCMTSLLFFCNKEA